MPRAHAILQSDYPYNISARCINREWFTISLEEVWNIFSEELSLVSQNHDLQIHSFVLMSNHFHLIASTPEANISTCMQRFMHKSSLRLTKRGNRINQTFAGRHHKCILQHQNYYLNAYKYNYRNPVTAGVCVKVEDYPFSTLPMIMGRMRKTIPLAEDTTYTEDPNGTIQWLNSAPAPELHEAARYGFKRPYFKSKRSRSDGRLILDEFNRL